MPEESISPKLQLPQSVKKWLMEDSVDQCWENASLAGLRIACGTKQFLNFDNDMSIFNFTFYFYFSIHSCDI